MTPQALRKKKKDQIFMETHVTPPTPLFPHHSFLSNYLTISFFLAGQLSSLCSFSYLFFFFSQHNTNSPLFTPLLSRQYHFSPLPPPFFSKITLKIHRKKVMLTQKKKKKCHSSFISKKIGLRQAEKETKIFVPSSIPT